MSRIRNEENITRTREAVSPKTLINWNPVTNDGTLSFHVQDIVMENGEVVALSKNKDLKADTLDTPFSELMGRTIMVPVDAENTVPVPVPLIMGAIKKLFDELYNERIAEQNAVPEPRQPLSRDRLNLRRGGRRSPIGEIE